MSIVGTKQEKRNSAYSKLLYLNMVTYDKSLYPLYVPQHERKIKVKSYPFIMLI